MSRRGRLMGLAIAAALLANGVANVAHADPGVCKPVKVCEPVKAAPEVPVCKPVTTLPKPEVCKPVKALPKPEVCKPAKTSPPPEVCKPAKTSDDVAHPKYAILQERIARIVSHFKSDTNGKEVDYDISQPSPSQSPPTPAPAPQSPAA
jgi:hypothetical protein